MTGSVFGAAVWAAALRGLEMTAGIVRLTVLARILGPVALGLFGAAMLVLTALDTFTNLNLDSALIQTRKSLSQFLPSAWAANMLRGGALGCLAFLLAPWIAAILGNVELISLIRVGAVTLIFNGAVNPRVVVLDRELRFRRRFFYLGTPIVSELVVAIGATSFVTGAWPLVLGLLSRSTVRLVGSYLVVKPEGLSFRLDLGAVAGLFHFGKWITMSGILVFLLHQGDDLLVVKLLGAMWLGYYQMAYRLSNIATTGLTHVISTVSFPVYANLQNESQQLQFLFLGTLKAVAMVSFPLFFGILVLGGDATRIVLGERWLPMVPAMKFLAVWGLGRSLAATTGPLFSGLGTPRINTILQLGKLFIVAVGIYPLTVRLGAPGTALTLAVAALVMDPLCVILASRKVGARLGSVLRAVSRPLVWSACIALVLAGIRFHLRGFSSAPELLGAGGAACAVFAYAHRDMVGFLFRMIESGRGHAEGIHASPPPDAG